MIPSSELQNSILTLDRKSNKKHTNRSLENNDLDKESLLLIYSAREFNSDQRDGRRMEAIDSIQLTDENIYPNEDVLTKVLGRSYAAYLELLKLYEENDLSPEWRYYRDGKAWLCKVQKKKRTIVWMSAWKGYMQAAIYFPERYLDDILKLGISDDTKNKILKTKNVGKSKPCIFEIRNKKALRDLEKVMTFKIQTK
jgi:hypothetical protein